MNFFIRIRIPVLLFFALTLFNSCTSAASMPTPTVAATSTTLPTEPRATATLQAAPTSTLPAEILTAIQKTRAVENVRYEITSEISYVQNGTTIKQPGLQAHGEESGEDRHLMISGTMKTSGELATFEFIILQGITYMKGLNGIPGVNPTQWYKFPPELGNMTRDAPTVKSLLADLQTEDLTPGAFQTAGSESFDHQACTIWKAHDTKLAEGFVGIANSREASAALQNIDDGEFRLWICADGFLHRLTGTLNGHDPNAPANKATLQMNFHLFDHNASIEIQAPENAKDFQVPVQGAEETPTPE